MKRVSRGFVKTICANHHVILTLKFNPHPLHNVAVTQQKYYGDNLHFNFDNTIKEYACVFNINIIQFARQSGRKSTIISRY